MELEKKQNCCIDTMSRRNLESVRLLHNLFLNWSYGVLKEGQQNQTNFRSMNATTVPFRSNSSFTLTDPKKDQIMTPLIILKTTFLCFERREIETVWRSQ